jgi:hypothetical protein
MECPFCNSSFSTKQSLIKHLNKKFKCKSTINESEYSDFLKKLEDLKHKRIKKINQNDLELSISKKDLNLECTICGKKFKSNTSIYYHRKNVCILSETIDKPPIYSNEELKNEIKELKDLILSKPTLSYINNGTINQQNIQFNDWGNEDLSFLNHNDIIEDGPCGARLAPLPTDNGPWQTVHRLFQKIHFNPLQLKNYNCRKPPGLVKTKLMEIKKNGRWIKCVRFQELAEKEQLLRNFIIDFAEENKDKISDKKYERILKYRDVMENRDINSKEYKDIIAQLELIAMNEFISMEEGIMALIEGEEIIEAYNLENS